MAIHSGPNIAENGLMLHVDAANPVSYPGTGTGWFDLSGLGNNGTLVNGVGYNAGNLGRLIFDGTDDYVDTGLTNQQFTSLNCTLEVFLNTRTIVNNKFTTIAGQRSNADDKTLLGLWIEARNSWPGNYSSNYGILGVTYGTAITPDFAIKSPPGSIQNDTWYHLVLVSSSTDTKLYINGILISTVVSAGTLNTSVLGTFGVGCYGLSSGLLQYPSNLNNSAIAITRVYNKSLTAQEVRQNFKAIRGRFGI